MVQKGRFNILYDNTLNKDNIIRTTSQKFPFIWTPQDGADNIGLLSLGSTGTYTGEASKNYIVYLTQNGGSGEGKFKFSNDAGESYRGWDGSNWVNYNGTNGRLVEFSDIDLTEGVTVTFAGTNSGETGDKFSFQAGYRFPIENVHDLRQGRTFRSTTDQLDWEAVWDLGSYGFLRSDMACMTGFNVNNLKLQANNTDSWAAPQVSKNVSFVDEGGTVNSVEQTRIIFNNGSFQQKYLIDKYVRITSGTAIDNMYKITDNYATEIIMADVELVDDGVAINDTFEIVALDRQITFNDQFVKRYIRMFIPSGETSEGYFQGSSFKIGKALDMNVDFQQTGYNLLRNPNVSVTQSVSGNEQVDWKGQPKRTFNINFDFLNDSNRNNIEAAANYLKDSKTPFFFVPDRNISGELYPVRFEGSRRRDFPVDGRFSEAWRLSTIR